MVRRIARAAQRAGRVQSAEPAADNDDMWEFGHGSIIRRPLGRTGVARQLAARPSARGWQLSARSRNSSPAANDQPPSPVVRGRSSARRTNGRSGGLQGDVRRVSGTQASVQQRQKTTRGCIVGRPSRQDDGSDAGGTPRPGYGTGFISRVHHRHRRAVGEDRHAACRSRFMISRASSVPSVAGAEARATSTRRAGWRR